MMVFTAVEIETEPGVFVADTPNIICVCVGSGAWVVTSASGSSEAGYTAAPTIVSFANADGIQSVEAGLPINNDLTKVQLQDIATQLGLSTSGLKAEILDRILTHLGE